MTMTLIETDGFLRGKCLPGDMKVNETNAEYLVRKFAEAEAKLTAITSQLESVVAENAAQKGALNKIAFTYSLSPHIHEMTTIAAPATSAFLAEVRASGVEMFADMTAKVADEEEFYDNGDSSESLKYTAKQARLFAAQLRQGGAV